MRPDRLSELISGPLRELIESVGKNETLTALIAEERGVKLTVTRQDKITFWQAFLAVMSFPTLVALLTAYIWAKDENKVVIHYVTDHLAITATGIFAGWILSMGMVFYLFRYIRKS